MILANFDLKFFISIPGMLITGGVLLLLIALIIFIATGNKKEKKNKDEQENISKSSTIDTEVSPIGMPAVEMPSENNINNMENSTTVAPQNNHIDVVAESSPINIVENTNNNDSAIEPNIITPMENTALKPTIEVNEPTPVINKLDSMQVVNPEPTPVVTEEKEAYIPNIPSVEEMTKTEVSTAPVVTIVNEEQKMPEVKIEEESPKAIYGGVSPVIPKIEVEGEHHRPIYGGANPLESTQNIPIVNSMPSNKQATQITPEIINKVEPKPIEHSQEVITPKVDVQQQKYNEPVYEEKAPKKEIEIESLF